MSLLAIAPIVAFYDYVLQPIPTLSWAGAPISTLDIAGALRLALILRQQREIFYKEHLAKLSLSTSARVTDGRLEEKYPVQIVPIERRSRVRDFATSLVVVFGGEAIVGALAILLYLRCRFWGLMAFSFSSSLCTAPWLGVQPSFFVSAGAPLLYLSAGRP
jgi:hypothetical protein